jgi:hypothetical protein
MESDVYRDSRPVRVAVLGAAAATCSGRNIWLGGPRSLPPTHRQRRRVLGCDGSSDQQCGNAGAYAELPARPLIGFLIALTEFPTDARRNVQPVWLRREGRAPLDAAGV